MLICANCIDQALVYFTGQSVCETCVVCGDELPGMRFGHAAGVAALCWGCCQGFVSRRDPLASAFRGVLTRMRMGR